MAMAATGTGMEVGMGCAIVSPPAFDQMLFRQLVHRKAFHLQPRKRLQAFPGLCLAQSVPPEKGRRRNARKVVREADLEGWTQVAISSDLQEGKNKAIIYNSKGYVLVKRESVICAIEANCTACKFPVIEGKVTEVDGELNIDCPLCHTRFCLVDGRVVEYCPKDGPIQWVIGTLKEKVNPVNAKVFPARISNSGNVYIRFANVQIV